MLDFKADQTNESSLKVERAIFEAFEASPPSHDVLAAGNALQCNFPEKTVSVPYSEFMQTSFQLKLASFLEQASTQPIEHFAPRTNKADVSIIEKRDTAKPSLITQMLMTLLEVIGHLVSPCPIRKRIRDDVCWNDGAERPWRRCAFWLVLRVGLRRHLCQIHQGESGRVQYKFFLCVILAHVIEHAVKRPNPEMLGFIVAKLARRLDKLEVARKQALPQDQLLYEMMFATLRQTFRRATKRANHAIETAWENFKKSIERPIKSLPLKADRKHMILSLPNSGPYLEQVLSRYTSPGSPISRLAPDQPQIDFNISGATTRRFREFADRYYSLSRSESRVEEQRLLLSTPTTDQEGQCLKFAEIIDSYLNKIGGAYDHNPEQKSIMVLTVMELWVSMDQCATACFDLLMDYSPSISPDILDCLHLIRFSDMCRLQRIQEHLSNRCKACANSSRTIFDKPVQGCFAERYYEESKDSPHLRSLHKCIEEEAEVQRRMKKQEWKKRSADFAELERLIAASTCLFYTSDDGVRTHDLRQCTKCYLQREAWRTRIDVHEHPLPSDTFEAKAVLFELHCPQALRVYRNVTWRMIGDLACPTRVAGVKPRLMLSDHQALGPFMLDELSGVTLGSTKKPFTLTHYRDIRLPVSFDEVCVPSGLRWGYYDPSTQAWLSPRTKPTLAHHFRLKIPTKSPLVAFALPTDRIAGLDGPSSYEIIASQTSCPSKLNIHDFMAYRGLLSGTFRRWPSMLVELGSANLNFSAEATTLLICHLAVQAGPRLESDSLREAHSIFRDEQFCQRLMEQIDVRLDGIVSNWRETNCMEMFLTLILRLCFTTSGLVVEEALGLLEKVRTTTLGWTRHLRKEIHRSLDKDVSQKWSRHAFCAALLCRRTFTVFSFNDIATIDTEILQPSDLECYIESSITLQDNLTRHPESLPLLSRNALVRDLKMVYRLRSVLSESLKASPSSLLSAIDSLWPQPQRDLSTSSTALHWSESPDESWITLNIAPTSHTRRQIILFHMLEGHLLVDGQPMGRLPAELRESPILEDLFDKQNLLTYPSALHGMSHTLASSMNGHQVHFGVSHKTFVVQACTQDTTLEYIPREVFRSASCFDLPASLVHDCVHWLDLRTGIIEIRQKPDIWKQKRSNWRIDLKDRTAKRHRSALVDSSSLLFRQVAGIFDRFEYSEFLTVFQPELGTLAVELRRLDLKFYVNQKELLECSQLRSEIDRDQDAGTWYGLQSKVVLRDIINPRHRTVIVPLGLVKYARKDIHPTVTLANNGSYARFSINNVLGRLDCPAEPRLLYLKVHLHACTSFVIADPLTGRTGTEEALHCLKSGDCQPWTSLNEGPLDILASIARLTPTRMYYPKDMKEMQQILWNPDLTTTIQRDEFQPLVEAIWETSKTLWTFGPKTVEHPPVPVSANTPHLLHRSLSRRRLHQRLGWASSEKLKTLDLPYCVRGWDQNHQARCNVYESVSLIRDRPNKLLTTSELVKILESWPVIGGFDREYVTVSLSGRLDIDFGPEWGSLVQLCRTSGLPESYRLMFLFALTSFRHDVDMDVIRTLIAFSTLEALKSIKPPSWSCYERFHLNPRPSVDYLMQLTQHCRIAYPGDERRTFGNSLHNKTRSKLESAELAHEQQSENDCKALSKFVLSQWPCPEPTVEGFASPPLINIHEAMSVIKPEWQRLFRNLELSRYTMQVQHVLDLHQAPRAVMPEELHIKSGVGFPARHLIHNLPSLSQDLMRKPGSKLSNRLSAKALDRALKTVSFEAGTTTIETLLKEAPDPEQSR